MDILSARKKAAELAKARKAEQTQESPQPASPAPLAEQALPAPEPEAVQAARAPETPAAEVPLPDESAQSAGTPAPAVSGALPPPRQREALAFRLGSEEYAVPVDRVREVIRVWEITPVPNAPEYVIGVTSLRGVVLPVIDPCLRLGLAPGARDERSRIIVTDLNDEGTGIIVDRVTGVVRFSDEDVRPAPESIEHGAEFLRGIVRKNDRLYILLDVDSAAGA
jgi:purine-binding chemotaxis protein CheW